MASIFELMAKIPPIVEVNLMCFSKNTVLFPIKDSTYAIQLAWYWFKEADMELTALDEDGINHEGNEEDRVLPLKPPTLISAEEQLEYSFERLTELTLETKELLDTLPLHPDVQYKVQRAYNRLMEARFNIETAKSHYGEVKRDREQ